MELDHVHPQFRQAVKRFPRLPLHNRLMLRLLNGLMRFAPHPSPGADVTVTERRLDNAWVRIYIPDAEHCGAALLWIHGGGLVIGNPKVNDRDCGAYARELGLVVVSVGYRLAPRHPFPAAIDDCFEAWRWLQGAAGELDIDPARVVVSGQSAGGGLAAALVQRIRDSGGVQPAGQALLSPMLDDRTAARRELDAIDHRVWNNRNNRAGWSFYLGQPAGAPEVPPYAVPARREDLSGLPPTWIGIGDIDLFHDESRRYAERLRAAGVPCEFETVPMAPHAFEMAVDAPLTLAYFEANHRFLSAVLDI
ncbi:MAG: alpha/beta hydrolase [Bacteroidales bacterium]|nr:alpha/beta hydrolase [Bacteroidales bacterium]